MQKCKKCYIIDYVTDVETPKEVGMYNTHLYYTLLCQQRYALLDAIVCEDLDDLLAIEPNKRTAKQKKAISYLQRFEKSVNQGKVNMQLFNKLKAAL